MLTDGQEAPLSVVAKANLIEEVARGAKLQWQEAASIV
jgi:hypothetical protein